MIYELRNKNPRNSSFLASEDVLTSTIFGNLRYFSNQNILIKFLNCSKDINGNSLRIDKNSIFEIEFWNKLYIDKNKYNEPDLYFKNDKYNIIIECKYNSFLNETISIDEDNGTVYTNQLIRYSKLFENSPKHKILIYLTNDINMPREVLSRSLKGINGNIQLYWLTWRMLYKVMNKINICNYNQGEQQLFNDLLLFLKKRKLTVFCGFSFQKIELYYKYCKNYHFVSDNFLSYNTWRYNNEK